VEIVSLEQDMDFLVLISPIPGQICLAYPEENLEEYSLSSRAKRIRNRNNH